MVRLNIDMIARGTSGYMKKKRDESMEIYLKRLTHLYLENRGINEVGGDLALCRNLVVLYLYDNCLPTIPNLLQNSNLTQLYLQNNRIKRIENLSGLNKLTKLFLGGNMITVVEGLDKLSDLQELHVESQKLPPGEKLLFDPRSIIALSQTLQVLDISGNNINSILDLKCLCYLQQFSSSDNNLFDFKELSHCLSGWRHLIRVDLLGNPLCRKTKYRDRIIALCNKLEILDGKEITDLSRKFIKSWHASKDKKKLSDMKNVNMGYEGIENNYENNSDFLPPIQRHQSVPAFMMPALPRRQFREILARSNSQPNSRPRTKPDETHLQQYNMLATSPRILTINCKRKRSNKLPPID